MHIKDFGRKAISFQEGDEFVVDLHKGELVFLRDEEPMNVVHAGFPYGTGTTKIHIKFQWRNESAMIVQEVEELAQIISALTWYGVERVSPQGCTKVKYRFIEGDKTRIKIDVKDQLVIDTLYGGVLLRKGGALYTEGSPCVQEIKLGSLYSFLDDEVFYTMQLVSVISQVELIFSKEARGVITYYCCPKISYAGCSEPSERDGTVIPFRRSSAAAE